MERSSSCSACRVVGAWWTLLKSVRSESNMNDVAVAKRGPRGRGGAAFQMRLGSLQSWRASTTRRSIFRVVVVESAESSSSARPPLGSELSRSLTCRAARGQPETGWQTPPRMAAPSALCWPMPRCPPPPHPRATLNAMARHAQLG